jgi:hypothetical protein
MAKQISIKAILEDLANGKTRDEISAELELNPVEKKTLWKHPKLQNKKPAKYKLGIEIVDDTVEVDYGTIPATTNPNAGKVYSEAPAMSGSF